VRDLCLVAGSLRRLDGGPVVVTILRRRVGPVWEDSTDPQFRAVRERANGLRARLERAAADLGLEVAAWAYTVTGDDRAR